MSLRILTWNVQMITTSDALDFEGPIDDGEAEFRADRVADALLGMPDLDRPEVVAFNEVFNEAGRRRLTHRLQNEYPNHHMKIDVGGIAGGGLNVDQDSGLAVMSRLPFEEMPDSDQPNGPRTTLNTVIFDAAEDWDGYSAKGAGVVAVDAPSGRVLVAFTHLQASYDSPDQYSDVRRKQLAQILDLLRASAGTQDLGAASVQSVIMGDLNIVGPVNLAAPPMEYASVFTDPALSLGGKLVDSWARFMPAEDPGLTQSEPARLDYQLLVLREGSPDWDPSVAQHQRVLHRGISDHAALWGHVNQQSAECTPQTAVPGDHLTQDGIGSHSSEQTRPGQYRWIRFDTPGTFTWFPAADGGTQASVFLARDISAEWPGYGDLHPTADQFDHHVLDLVTEFALDPRGTTVALPEAPWFVRLRASEIAVDRAGHRLAVGWVRHTGASPADALVLFAGELPLDPAMPVGTRLNPDDRLWTRTSVPRLTSGAQHTPEWYVNEIGPGARLELFPDPPAAALASTTSGAAPRAVLTHATSGDDQLLFAITRADPSVSGFQVGWNHSVAFLRDGPSHPLTMLCDDETGPDWMGDDELRIVIKADGIQVLDQLWNNVDTGDPQYLTPYLATPPSYAEKLEVTAQEIGDIDGRDGRTRTIDPIPADHVGEFVGTHSFPIASGHYTLYYCVSRWIPGGG